MTEELNGDLLSEFSDLPAPRSGRNQYHPVISIVDLWHDLRSRQLG